MTSTKLGPEALHNQCSTAHPAVNHVGRHAMCSHIQYKAILSRLWPAFIGATLQSVSCMQASSLSKKCLVYAHLMASLRSWMLRAKESTQAFMPSCESLI